MGKALKDLLGEFQFKEPQFNPRQVTPDMLSSKEVGPTTGDIRIKNDETKILGITIPKIDLTIDGISLPYDRQYQKLAANALDIYGTDAVRILSRGAVDPLQLAKRSIDRSARTALDFVGLNNTKFGGFIRNGLNSFTVPQFPSDEVNNPPGKGNEYTKGGLYTSLFNGGVNNNKNAIANVLTSFATKKQFEQNVATIGTGGKVSIGGAAIDTTINTAFNALQNVGTTLGLNSKRGGGNKSLSAVKQPLNENGDELPIYPSSYAETSFKKTFGKQTDLLSGIATGQDQLLRDSRFYTKYEGVNANDKLNTIRVDGKKYTSIKPSVKDKNTGLSKFIREDLKFKGYLKFDESTSRKNVKGDTVGNAGGTYKFFNIESATEEDLREYSFSKKVYLETAKGISSNYNGFISGSSEQVINTELFAGTKVSRQKAANKQIKRTAGIFDLEELEEVQVIQGKNHRQLSRIALFSDDKDEADLITIYLKDVDSKSYIVLMSNLTGLTDNPTPTWGEAKPIGSPNKFYFYESFEREISFKGQLYAHNEVQLIQLWYKINFLQNLTLATSGGTNGIKGTICELKIGEFVEQPYGFITNCTITVPDNSPWEIQPGAQVPFICEFDITYKVIYDKNTSFNEVSIGKIPQYKYLEAPLPGLNFNKPLGPKQDKDIKKLRGLSSFFNEANDPEANPTPGSSATTGGFSWEVNSFEDETKTMNQLIPEPKVLPRPVDENLTDYLSVGGRGQGGMVGMSPQSQTKADQNSKITVFKVQNFDYGKFGGQN